MRLAYFNVFTSNAEAAVKYYTGVPVTYAALVFPVVFACHGLLSTALAGTVIRIFFVLMSLLFVLRINVAKPQGRFYFVFVVLALMVGLYWLYRATC